MIRCTHDGDGQSAPARPLPVDASTCHSLDTVRCLLSSHPVVCRRLDGAFQHVFGRAGALCRVHHGARLSHLRFPCGSHRLRNTLLRPLSFLRPGALAASLLSDIGCVVPGCGCRQNAGNADAVRYRSHLRPARLLVCRKARCMAGRILRGCGFPGSPRGPEVVGAPSHGGPSGHAVLPWNGRGLPPLLPRSAYAAQWQPGWPCHAAAAATRRKHSGVYVWCPADRGDRRLAGFICSAARVSSSSSPLDGVCHIAVVVLDKKSQGMGRIRRGYGSRGLAWPRAGYHVAQMIRMFPPAMAVLVGLGLLLLLVSRRAWKTDLAAVLLLWLGLILFLAVTPAESEPRFLLTGTACLIVLAAAGWESCLDRRWPPLLAPARRIVPAAAAILALFFSVTQFLRFPHQWDNGSIHEVARIITEDPLWRGAGILLPTDDEGPLVAEFVLRDPHRPSFVLNRPSRVLASLGFSGASLCVEVYQSPSDLMEALSKKGVGLIVLHASTDVQKIYQHDLLLRDVLSRSSCPWRPVPPSQMARLDPSWAFFQYSPGALRAAR